MNTILLILFLDMFSDNSGFFFGGGGGYKNINYKIVECFVLPWFMWTRFASETYSLLGLNFTEISYKKLFYFYTAITPLSIE